ncbi:MAG: hypothetical protein ACE5HE_14810, partial [Phycisphaerae bacterium]
MTSRPGVSNIAPLPAKRSVELLTWATVLFVLLTGLVPFDFAGAPHQHGSEEPFGVLVPTFIFPDAAGNLFLYLPIGVLLHWYLWRRLASPTAACLLAIGAAALLSGTVEFLQVYSSSRF